MYFFNGGKLQRQRIMLFRKNFKAFVFVYFKTLGCFLFSQVIFWLQKSIGGASYTSWNLLWMDANWDNLYLHVSRQGCNNVKKRKERDFFLIIIFFFFGLHSIRITIYQKTWGILISLQKFYKGEDSTVWLLLWVTNSASTSIMVFFFLFSIFKKEQLLIFWAHLRL